MANGEETEVPACPFAAEWVEAAKRVFLANPGWKRIYDAAPPGAKRRLEVSFWFSENLSGRKDIIAIIQTVVRIPAHRREGT